MVTEVKVQSGGLGAWAKDVGIKLGTLYSEVLDDEVDTYIKRRQFNAKSLVEYLR